MKGKNVQLRSEMQEKACADFFLGWYNRHHGTSYYSERAEDVFPALRNMTRWEFVIRQYEGDPNWFAIEVKRFPTMLFLKKEWNNWDKFLRQVTKDPKRRIKGSFSVTIGDDARLEFDQRSRNELRRAIVDALVQAAPEMEAGLEIDLGPKIARQFPEWPITFDYDAREWIPEHFEVKKVSNGGCEVTLSMTPVVVQDHEKAYKELMQKALSEDFPKASEQLGEAKDKGAKETILLFCCDPHCDEILVKKYMQRLDPCSIPNIDCIYLVEVDGRVIQIYPASAE